MKNFLSFLILSTIVILLITTCRKDHDDNNTGGGPQNTAQATITGIVTDENNNSLSTVNINAYGQTATTDTNGIFVLKNASVNKSRCIIQFSKTGFYNRSHAFTPFANKVNYVRIVLTSRPAALNISSSAGGTINLTGGASVQFQPNSFKNANGMSYSGTVSVTVKHLATDNANFGFMIPGGDLAGKDASDKDVVLYSYGMIGVELQGSSGEQLQLTSGKTATLTLPVATAQVASAPATIPLWYFDEATSLWKEEGQAIKVGNNYIGTVTHFTWWNGDYAGPRATIIGKVVDCNGQGVANISVNVNNVCDITTNQDGVYSSWIPAGMPLSFQVQSNNNNFGLSSQLENVQSLSSGQTFTVLNLVTQCLARITGNLKNCTNESVNGTAVLFSNGTLLNYEYTNSGSFNLASTGNTSLLLYATSETSSNSQTFTSPNLGNTLNLGNIQLCDSIKSNFSFILNGDGFNNTLVTIDPVLSSNAFYGWQNWTVCGVNGLSNFGPTSLNINFPANHVGSFILPAYHGTGIDSTRVLHILGTGYFQVYADPINPFTLTVTHYGNVGELITGIFSGRLGRGNYYYQQLSYVDVTNGRFSFVRGPDQ